MSKHIKLGKVTGILSIVSNLLLFFGVVAGVVVGIFTKTGGLVPNEPWYYEFFYFTVLSNILLGITSLIMVIYSAMSLVSHKIPRIITNLKFIATVSTTVTFVTVLLVFSLIMGVPYINLIQGGNLFLHLIVPLLAIFSLGFIELHNKIRFSHVPFALIPPLVYGVVYAFGYYFKWEWFKDDVYAFIKDSHIFYMPLIVAFIVFIIAVLLYTLCQFTSIEDVKKEEEEAKQEQASLDEIEQIEEIIEKEKKKENTKKTSKKEEEPVAPKRKPIEPEKEDSDKEKVRTYHVSRTKDGDKWQVKLSKGAKAIKLFNTQAEAIEYAKSLVETQGGSIRVHSMKGSIRKV